jgi:hypothetical protein
MPSRKIADSEILRGFVSHRSVLCGILVMTFLDPQSQINVAINALFHNNTYGEYAFSAHRFHDRSFKELRWNWASGKSSSCRCLQRRIMVKAKTLKGS